MFGLYTLLCNLPFLLTCVIMKVAEFGSYDHEDGLFPIMAEIFLRGPVKASINAGPLQRYKGGIILDSPANRNTTHNHGVSIVGWGHDDTADIQYWIVRNSVGYLIHVLHTNYCDCDYYC